MGEKNWRRRRERQRVIDAWPHGSCGAVKALAKLVTKKEIEIMRGVAG